MFVTFQQMKFKSFAHGQHTYRCVGQLEISVENMCTSHNVLFAIVCTKTTNPVLTVRGYQRNSIFHVVQKPFLTDSHLFSVV